MKVFLMALVAFAGLNVQADMLNTAKQSPYSILKSAPAETRQQFAQEVLKWGETNQLTSEQKQAFNSLVSESPEMSGDEVLENLDAQTISWFYGYELPGVEKVYPAARISELQDINTCMTYRLCVVVSKTEQRMYVYEDGYPSQSVAHNQAISTARPGKYTPTGIFSVEELAGKDRRSSLYKGAYLGYAMQIHGNIFLHATSVDQYPKLGRPASAGCVRMDLDSAADLNRKMRVYGRSNIRVVVAD